MSGLGPLALGAVGLILLVAFVAARLVRARRAGLSIRMQVFLALATIVGAFALGLGVLVVERTKARATLLAESAARDEATLVAALLASELSPSRSLEALASELERGARRERLPSLTLRDARGRVLFSSGARGGTPGTVAVEAPIVSDGAHVGAVAVEKPTIVVERLLADVAPTVLLLSTVLGAAAAAAAALIGRAIARPIEALTEFAVRVSEGDLHAVSPPPQGREVRRLSSAIDTMRRALEGRPFVEAFAADLSHELKNPVAAVRASAEVLADGALDEPEEARRFVARIVESTSRIEALLGDLLSLARVEARGLEESEDVDLAALLRDLREHAQAEGRSLELSLETESALVRGDARWLSRMLDNLVENALAHGEGAASVRVTREADQVVVRVANQGSVDPHVRGQLFRRFVTTRRDRGGTGLGLAIARAVAEAHRGRVDCEEVGPPRVVFTARWPAA